MGSDPHLYLHSSIPSFALSSTKRFQNLECVQGWLRCLRPHRLTDRRRAAQDPGEPFCRLHRSDNYLEPLFLRDPPIQAC
jgi:hypothetical protein